MNESDLESKDHYICIFLHCISIFISYLALSMNVKDVSDSIQQNIRSIQCMTITQ